MTHGENKIGDNPDIIDPDEKRIAALLSGLERVEAPGDFDFRLRARIASARPAEVRPVRLFPILKYALPLMLFLFTGAAVLYIVSLRDGLDTQQVSVPDASDRLGPINSDELTVAERAELPVPTPAAESVTPAVPPVRRVSAAERAAAPVSGRSVDFSRSTAPVVPGNSTVRTLRVNPTVITPPGISLEPMDVRKALGLLGVDAEFRDNDWIVSSVRPGGVGRTLGLRPGDRLKAIDGKPIEEETKFNTGIGAASVTVQRDGRMIDLRLASPQR